MAIKYRKYEDVPEPKGFTKQDWDEVADNPPITKEQMKQAKPFKEAFPELAESIVKSRGRPKTEDPKEAITLRLPRSVLERWKRDPEWRAKMAEVLEKAG
ncbi:BrnA antitoxin family protein [Sinorhizobium sp. RAC02]|uniref:BrnA antitoxin family protein n=1 Tax=Sinorhizobium sp. RAC02 TaxID=1842534 RepID=UPI00083E5E09|nr:BrnA antitoxin family protein [Sinorhizobium sp. RAC02]AOF93037.1 hypothetical protein BSY16_4071 [Sinorhizobium sp. RAC02]